MRIEGTDIRAEAGLLIAWVVRLTRVRCLTQSWTMGVMASFEDTYCHSIASSSLWKPSGRVSNSACMWGNASIAVPSDNINGRNRNVNDSHTFYHIEDSNARHNVLELLEFWTSANDNRTTHAMSHELSRTKTHEPVCQGVIKDMNESP